MPVKSKKPKKRNATGPTKAFTTEQVAKALWNSGGFIGIAAKKLRCCTDTVQIYVKNNPELNDVIAAVREQNLDLAEDAIMKNIKVGNIDAAKFYLKYIGRERGYIERTELSGIGGKPIGITITPARIGREIEN